MLSYALRAKDRVEGKRVKVLIRAVRDEIWEEALGPLEKLRLERGDIEILFYTKGKDIIREIRDTDIFVGGNLTREQLLAAERLKMYQFYWTGVNRVDFDVLRERGVILANTHENKYPVSELAWALILAVTKKLFIRDRELRRGVWFRGYKPELMGVELRGKKLGILGLGNIGMEIARVGLAFGMEVSGTRYSVEKVISGKEDKKLSENGLSGIKSVYPPRMTRELSLASDIIVVALPLTEETRGLLNWEILRDMRGKILINISRGEVVEEEALYRALNDGILAGAGIDTWYNYPTRYGDLSEIVAPSRFPFEKFDNIVMTAHIAGFSLESHKRNTKNAIKNVVRFIEGKSLENIVDINSGY